MAAPPTSGVGSATAARGQCRPAARQGHVCPWRTDVVCLPCAVNTCGNDSPASHASPCRSAASAKPHTALLGKRDTAPRRVTLPMKAAAQNHRSFGQTAVFTFWRNRRSILCAAQFLCIRVFAASRFARYSAASMTLEGASAGTVPIIFTPSVQPQTLTSRALLSALGISLAVLSVLVCGLLLKPSSTGTGTHRQLGYHPCTFLKTTNLPCPSCGMTTSVSWFSRGKWLASFYVQPGGFLLALACGAIFWAGLYAFMTASPLHRLIRQVPGIYSVPAILGFFIAAWGWKIFIHLKGIDGWR